MKKRLMLLAAFVGITFGGFAQEPKQEKITLEPAKVLIAYYSWGGNTKYAAEAIRKLTGGTLFEIKPVTPYPKDFKECVNQAMKEVRAKFKPELASKVDDLGKYDVIFVGTPNWIGTIAPPVASFLSSSDLKGKTVIPFVTHGRGGLQKCERDIRQLCEKSTVLKAGAFSGATIKQSDAKIEEWVKSVVTLPEKK